LWLKDTKSDVDGVTEESDLTELHLKYAYVKEGKKDAKTVKLKQKR
jgi:hypothetical protein